MEEVMKAINEVLKEKETSITLLRFENDRLKREISELKNDIEKYKENEVNMA